MTSYQFMALAAEVTVRCTDPHLMQQLQKIWPSDSPCPERPRQHHHYELAYREGVYSLRDETQQVQYTESANGLWYLLDKSILIRLQRQNPDLYFVHGAVLVHRGQAVLLTGSSGVGKSSLALALALKPDWLLLSDELAPVDVRRGLVYPYRRAIGLKTAPPSPLELPAGSLLVDGGIHVPVECLARSDCPPEVPLSMVVSVAGQFARDYAPGKRLAPSESAMILLRNVLNSLAHPGNGLPAAIELAARVPCVNLPRMRLGEASALVHDLAMERAT